MTEAQIRTAVQNLVRDYYGTAGTWLGADETILDDFIDDALEQVVLDLMPVMPGKFGGNETISLEADEPDYTLTAEWWQIYKMERNVTDRQPKEIDIFDPLDKAKYMYVGETKEEPRGCMIIGKTITFAPTPSTDKTDYANCVFIRPEAVSLAAGGPTYMPRPAHRMIVYAAAAKIAVMKQANPAVFLGLYEQRLRAVIKVFTGQNQQTPDFVRDSMEDRLFRDDREAALYDVTGFFDD